MRLGQSLITQCEGAIVLDLVMDLLAMRGQVASGARSVVTKWELTLVRSFTTMFPMVVIQSRSLGGGVFTRRVRHNLTLEWSTSMGVLDMILQMWAIYISQHTR